MIKSSEPEVPLFAKKGDDKNIVLNQSIQTNISTLSRRRFMRVALVGGAVGLSFWMSPSQVFADNCSCGTPGETNACHPKNSCTGSNTCTNGSTNKCDGSNTCDGGWVHSGNTCSGTGANSCTGNTCSGKSSNGCDASTPNSCSGNTCGGSTGANSCGTSTSNTCTGTGNTCNAPAWNSTANCSSGTPNVTH